MTKTKYSTELLQDAVTASTSYAGVLRYLGIPQAGGSQTYIKSRIDKDGIDTSHFTGQGWNRGGRGRNRKSASDYLVLKTSDDHKTDSSRLRRSLVEIGRACICEICGLRDQWNGSSITLEIDHIDGDWWDNRAENLRFLCPNCHSQQAETNRSWKRTTSG